MTKQELSIIVDKLVQLGEDRDELDYWLEIFEDLPEDTQLAIYNNLNKELQDLQK